MGGFYSKKNFKGENYHGRIDIDATNLIPTIWALDAVSRNYGFIPSVTAIATRLPLSARFIPPRPVATAGGRPTPCRLMTDSVHRDFACDRIRSAVRWGGVHLMNAPAVWAPNLM